jgi:hypothetical protein
MRWNKTLTVSLACVALAGGLGAQCPSSNGFSDVRAPFARTGVDADARGEARSTLSGVIAQLQVDVAGLAANTRYEVAVDGAPKAALVTNASGAGRALLRSGDSASDLDFDPRGREVEVRRGGDDVLVADLRNGGGAPGAAAEFVLLDPAPGVAGRAKAEHRTRDGREKLSVEVEHVVPGSYALFVNGTQRGTIQAAFDPARGEVRGEIEFDSRPDDSPHDELLLDFAVADAQIDLVFGDAIVFGGVLRAGVPSVNVCQPSELLRRLAGPAGSEGKARFRVRDDCDRDFEVEIEDVAAGAYTLRVGGVVRGTITAAFDPSRGRVRGEIEFDTDADDADELPLGFDPRGQSVEVLSGAQVVFSLGVFEPGAISAPIPCSPVDVEIEQGLFPGAAQPAASGHTRLRLRDDCRADLSVEFEDVTAGSYDVVVGGVVRASVQAVFVPALGQVRGAIDFGEDEPGSPPLDFDPREQAIEIVQDGVAVLSTAFGGGAGNPNGSCVDDRTEVALLNQGVDANARAEARLRVRDDCRRSFTVEIEDVAPGSYTLLVDGAVEGTIAVGALGQGELELDTADPPKPVLDFDPRGREIAIAQGATLLFARIFPQ